VIARHGRDRAAETLVAIALMRRRCDDRIRVQLAWEV
jgi:hypothetical protein